MPHDIVNGFPRVGERAYAVTVRVNEVSDKRLSRTGIDRVNNVVNEVICLFEIHKRFTQFDYLVDELRVDFVAVDELGELARVMEEADAVENHFGHTADPGDRRVRHIKFELVVGSLNLT